MKNAKKLPKSIPEDLYQLNKIKKGKLCQIYIT